MRNDEKRDLALRFVSEVVRLVPEYLLDPADAQMSGGSAALVVLDDAGQSFGRIFGADKARGRECFGVATRKALQVLATGCATGKFEELVYARKLDERAFGLRRPDLIGWLGGVPLRFADGGLLAAAFSGFRGETDVAIVTRAASAISGLTVATDSP